MQRLAFSLHSPSPQASPPALNFPPQQCLGRELNIPTSFSCHLLYHFKKVHLLRTSPWRQEDNARVDCSRLSLPHVCSCFSKCPSLPPSVAFWSLCSLASPHPPFLPWLFSDFYLRIPNLFIKFPCSLLPDLCMFYLQQHHLSLWSMAV